MKVVDKHIVELIVDTLVTISVTIAIIVASGSGFVLLLTINVLMEALIIGFNRLAVLLNDLFELQISCKTGISRHIFRLHILLETIPVFPLSVLTLMLDQCQLHLPQCALHSSLNF